MAIRRYDCPAVTSKSIAMINQEINLSSINNRYNTKWEYPRYDD